MSVAVDVTVEKHSIEAVSVDGSPCFIPKSPSDYEADGEAAEEPPESCQGADACPDRFVCLMGAFFGHCCPKDTEGTYVRYHERTSV